uniref:F-box domain-containing protein n=1 Tax=Hanusia phi TaxID=3032 RepID=A0A7S0HQB4_9CRYP
MEKLQMGGLSDDLILKVFSRVDEYPLVASCSRLNRRFNQILNCDSLWEDICKRVMHGKQPPQNGFDFLPGPGESFKHVFLRVLYDVSRLEISREELINSSWRFYFCSDMYLYHASPEQAAQRDSRSAWAFFSPDGIFMSTVPGAPSQRSMLKWQLLLRSEEESGKVEGKLCSSEEKGTHVQIGSYPVLGVTRTQNWGWCLASKFVLLLSENSPEQKPKQQMMMMLADMNAR